MDVDDAVRFRRQAEICREESSKARDLVDAASWLRLADDFENLAARGKGCGRQALAVRAHEPQA